MTEPVITITLPAPVETVWDAFRDFEQVREWHGWETEGGEGSLDDEIRLIYGEGVIASEADRTLHIGGHLFSLVPDGAQTIVRVTRVTPTAAAAEAMDWDAWYDDVDEGWLSFLQQLRFALAAHWGEQRATIHLQSAQLDALPRELADVADDPGTHYEATIAGEVLSGEVWFRSRLQLGLTVDAWGPGLLIFAIAPSGGAAITLTTYDGDNAERAARWRAWWEALPT